MPLRRILCFDTIMYPKSTICTGDYGIPASSPNSTRSSTALKTSSMGSLMLYAIYLSSVCLVWNFWGVNCPYTLNKCSTSARISEGTCPVILFLLRYLSSMDSNTCWISTLWTSWYSWKFCITSAWIIFANTISYCITSSKTVRMPGCVDMKKSVIGVSDAYIMMERILLHTRELLHLGNMVLNWHYLSVVLVAREVNQIFGLPLIQVRDLCSKYNPI